jgi:hypothetical protein
VEGKLVQMRTPETVAIAQITFQNYALVPRHHIRFHTENEFNVEGYTYVILYLRSFVCEHFYEIKPILFSVGNF